MTTTIDFGPEPIGTLTSHAPGDRDSVVRHPAVGIVEVPAGQATFLEVDSAAGLATVVDVPAGVLDAIIVGDATFDDTAAIALSRIGSAKMVAILSPLITDEGVKALASLPGLASTHFEHADLTDESLVTLSNVSALTTISAAGSFTSVGIKALSRLPDLASLQLSGGTLDPSIGTVLATFPSLATLKLVSPSVTDDYCAGLASCATVTSLDVSQTSITDDGALAFTALPPTVTSLKVPETVSESVQFALRLAIPNIDLNGLALSPKAAKKLAASKGVPVPTLSE